MREDDDSLRRLIEQLPVVFWSLDTEMRATSRWGAGHAALNEDRNLPLGLPLAEYLRGNPPHENVIEAHRRALAGETVAYETQYQGRYFQSRVQPLRDPQGAIVGCLGVGLDITERKQAETQLQEYAERLRTLSRRLLEVQEAERRFLARELHDEFGQVLTGLSLALEAGTRARGQALKKSFDQAQGFIKELAARMRDLSLRLRPTMLDDLGLVPALIWQLERYTKQTGIDVSFEHRGADRRFPIEVETAAYRIVQEALTNVARHAGTRKAIVRLWLDDNLLKVRVEDEGAGFNAEAALASNASSGLSGMRERAILLGGQLLIESAPRKGTRLTAELPASDSVF